jgi:hypothetical protein
VRAWSRSSRRGRYPLLLTSLDTSGEKPYEEFVGEGEHAIDLGWTALTGVSYVAPRPAALEALFTLVDGAMTGRADPLQDGHRLGDLGGGARVPAS